MNFGVFVLLAGIANSTLNLFLYCFFGGFASDNFNKMATKLYKSDWLELPINLQKYFILMIGNVQKPLYYHGFGIVILNLETFTKVSWIWKHFEWIQMNFFQNSFQFLRSIYTCYMMFKAMTTK